jgi:hypothetical protein
MMKGFPDFPYPRSHRLELNVFHEEMGLLTLQVIAAPITFGPP